MIDLKEMTAYDVALEYGRAYDFSTLTTIAGGQGLTGIVRFFHHPNPAIGTGIILERADRFPDGFKAGYLLDNGLSITPAHAVAWHHAGNYAMLRYPQKGQLHAPRRFYHLKLEAA